MHENFLRSKLQLYVQHLIDITASYEMDTQRTTKCAMTPQNTGYAYAELGVGPYFPDDEVRRREVYVLRNRVEGWIGSRGYKNFVRDFQGWLRRRTLRSFDVRHVLSRLRSATGISDATAVRIFFALGDAVGSASDDQVTELLGFMPMNAGGVFPVAQGLFSGRWEVRRGACRVLKRVEGHRVGGRVVRGLNGFLRVGLERVWREVLREGEEVLEDGVAGVNGVGGGVVGGGGGGGGETASRKSVDSETSGREGSLTRLQWGGGVGGEGGGGGGVGELPEPVQIGEVGSSGLGSPLTREGSLSSLGGNGIQRSASFNLERENSSRSNLVRNNSTNLTREDSLNGGYLTKPGIDRSASTSSSIRSFSSVNGPQSPTTQSSSSLASSAPTPSSPVVRRLLAQQQAKQEMLRQKLGGLKSGPGVLVEDVLNPDFRGRR
ncbi:hypothetical protein HDV00_005416, partial [Rhizophlyctis rosea]